MPMLNFRLAQPELLVDLGAIDELSGVDVSSDWVRIGAMTRYALLMAHPDVCRLLPLVARALPHVAHPAIRNRGTVGGSIALADPAAELPAVMSALGARFCVAGPDGERTINADDFFEGLYETALEEDELLTAIEVPAATADDRFGFCEIARRHGDYAMAGVAIALRQGQPSIVFFAVSDRPARAVGAEAVLKNDLSAIDAAVNALGDIDFARDLNASADTKRHLAGVVLRRAWNEVMS